MTPPWFFVCLKGDESKRGFQTLASLLNHFKRFLASDGFIFNIFFLVPKTPVLQLSLGLWARVGLGGESVEETLFPANGGPTKSREATDKL